MREIKFRGLGVDGKWWFGESNPSGENHINLATFFANIHAGAIRPETVGEWTGLRDKNGREIWEGDIVSDATMKGLYEVKWSDEFSQINCKSLLPSHYELSIHTLGEIEVIGNIWENPELIKEGK
ncbi:MAG TPA: YopX family protein [Dehalococcoidia bacterium]|nr:YopX family protein [Dehalococcoidia bacterium]